MVAEFLGSTALFRGADPAVIAKIAPHATPFDFAAGATIIRAGVQSETMGVLFSGRAGVRIINASTGEGTSIEEIRIGDHFGEVQALLGTAQPTAVVAEDESTVLLIRNDVAMQLAQRIPAFSHALAKRLATRMVQQGVQALRKSMMVTPGPAPAPEPASARGLSGSAVPDGVIPFVRISAYDITEQLLSLVPAKLMMQHRFLPLKLEGHTLEIGMVDPHNAGALADLKRMLHSVELELRAVSVDDYNQTLVRYKIDSIVPSGGMQDGIRADQLVFDGADSERDADKAVRVIGDEVITLVNKIVAYGIDKGASDIHIEEEQTGVKIRFRIQGTLVPWEQFLPQSYARSLVARLKVLAGMDITERRLPLDGRIGLKIGRREIDLRISTMPATRGEKVVLRVFEAATMMRPLESVFMESRTLTAMRDALNRPYGAIIVAGPTGSGKSSTLYAALHERIKTRPDTNVCMVEDPVEYRLQGVTQVSVNHAVDLTFSRVLRGFMRLDPDVIMVGESRDPETAQLTLEASMTGHLVFTSFHASDAMSVLQRLEQLGCTRTMIAQSVSFIAVQRLARRLCARCASTGTPPPVLIETLAARGLIDRAAPVPLPKAAGCAECNQTGYVGRVAVIESLQVDDELRAQLIAGESLPEIEKTAIAKGLMIPFRRYASFLMTRKIIDPGEALLTVAR